MSLTLDEVRTMTVAVLTRDQVAAVLGVDRRTVGRAVDDGTIPTLRLGSRVLIPRERFLAWFDGDSEGRASTV